MWDRKLRAEALTIEELVAHALAGKIRIPAFQRGLKWDLRDARRLLESVLQEFPIGTPLLWEKPADSETLVFGGVTVTAPQSENAWWVVDGQQRIITLVNALADKHQTDERFALDYDLATGRLIPARPDTRGEMVIPLPVLWDLPSLLGWSLDRPHLSEAINEANVVAARLRNYRINVSVVGGADEATLRDIFDRMNNYGRRLTRPEIFQALNPSSSQEGGATLALVAERIASDTGFGLLDDDTVFSVLISRRGSDVSREVREEFGPDRESEFPDEARDEAFENGRIAATQAIQFLQHSVGIPHVAFLPYKYLLVVLSRFFAHFPILDDRQQELLARWTWRAASVGPIASKGSATGQMRTLNNLIMPGHLDDSLNALLQAMKGVHWELPEANTLRTNTAASRLILSAMWTKGPRSPITGDRFTVSDLGSQLSDARSANAILPDLISRSRLSPTRRLNAGNRYFGLDDGSVPDLLTPDLLVLTHDRDAILASHLVTPTAVQTYQNREFDRFVAERTREIQRVTEEFLLRKRSDEHDDTPTLSSLILDDEEDADLDEQLS